MVTLHQTLASTAQQTSAPRAEIAEESLRQRLGVPTEARRVLIFGESSHWDPNWLHTSEEYYEQRIQEILDEVIEALLLEPRRIFSLECLFFLKLYWERRPEQQDDLRRLVNDRRLRLTGTGITTPDTLLPETEAILRDYLAGQEWLRGKGMSVEPDLAYLPDDFGHSPHLPALLSALGFSQACITRIDGMYFVGADYRRRSAFPLAGSSAELLLRELKTLDFRWLAPDGSEVLCHWNAFTYFQGDMLAHKGIIRWMGLAFGLPWRTPRHIARRVEGFVRELAPLGRTPYLFCPIGCDFNGPIPDLVALVDRHNDRFFQRTGVWTVVAGLDDYLELVGAHREALPVVALDPNPYWMGFYASRPQIKHCCNRITRKLALADRFSSLRLAAGHDSCGVDGRSADQARIRAAAGWDLLVVSNHHDFITGTSPDRVFFEEQRPWLEQAESHADAALLDTRCSCLATAGAPVGRPPAWRLEGGRLEVTSRHYRLVLSEELGGCLVSYRDIAGGSEILAGPANDIVAYRDSGGLWRMGHEYRGGVFRGADRTSRRAATIHALERDGLLEVRVDSFLEGLPFVRWLWLSDESPLLRLRIQGAAGNHRTITCRFPTVIRAETLIMDVPGGVVERPAQKIYQPTFWPARSFVHLCRAGGGPGMAVFLGGPACASLTGPGALEWVALRNAPRELAFGLLPVLAHPASGSDSEEHALDYAVQLTPGGDFRENRLPFLARLALGETPPSAPSPETLVERMVTVDNPQVLVTAVKRASRGQGLVVRLQRFTQDPVEVRLHCALRPLRAARRCDARERDLEALEIVGGNARIHLQGSITSLRLLF